MIVTKIFIQRVTEYVASDNKKLFHSFVAWVNVHRDEPTTPFNQTFKACCEPFPAVAKKKCNRKYLTK